MFQQCQTKSLLFFYFVLLLLLFFKSLSIYWLWKKKVGLWWGWNSKIWDVGHLATIAVIRDALTSNKCVSHFFFNIYEWIFLCHYFSHSTSVSESLLVGVWTTCFKGPITTTMAVFLFEELKMYWTQFLYG